MKNQNKVRNEWGYYFTFQDRRMVVRFIQLFGDRISDFQMMNDNTLKIVVGKGVIPYIKKMLGDMIEVSQHGRYYVKEA